MIVLLRRLTDTWHAPRRARLLYVAMAAGFAGLAIAGIVLGDALVATVGAIVAVFAAALAVVAPRLTAWLRDELQ